MHEMSLCEGILQIIQSEAEQQGFNRVKNVWLEIGDLAGIEVDAMRFGFDAVMHNSLVQGAGLHIIPVPGQAWCLDCGKTVEISQRYVECPECGGYQLQVTGGDEMKIKELEVE